jgi:hypothetical protein
VCCLVVIVQVFVVVVVGLFKEKLSQTGSGLHIIITVPLTHPPSKGQNPEFFLS